VKERQGRNTKLLLDDIKEKRGNWKLEKETLDHTLWGTGFGRCCGPIVW